MILNLRPRAAIVCGALVLSTMGIGCAHIPSESSTSKIEPLEIPAPVVETKPMSVLGIELKRTDFDWPVVMNSRVEFWVDYFTNRGRPHFEQYLHRSEYFIPFIEPILKEHKVPRDLVYLAMIESGFNNHARSRAKAVGAWQFISPTGRRYGLEVNWWVDERRDVRKSTLAAIYYLRDLYQIFQSWELAAAAYNAGESKVASAVRRYGTRDFWAMARHQYLRPETRDYVPKMMAAAIVEKNRTLFGFPQSYRVEPGEGETLASDGSVVKLVKEGEPEPEELKSETSQELADSGVAWEEDAMRLTNESEIEDVINEYATHYQEEGGLPATLVGASRTVADSERKSDANASERKVFAYEVKNIPFLSRKGKVGGEQLVQVEIKSPADLLKVAHAAGLSYRTVKKLNPEILRWVTPPTEETFRIYLPLSAKKKFLATYNHPAFPREVRFRTYTVQPGDTISKIARRFGIQAEPVEDLNGIGKNHPLKKGRQILLPLPSDRSRSIAALDLSDPPLRASKKKRRAHFRTIQYDERRSARSLRNNGT